MIERDLETIRKVAKVLEHEEIEILNSSFVVIIEKLVKKLEWEQKQVKVNQYQDWTARTAPHFDDIVEEMVAWSMGIAGEAGEYCDIVKKEVWHNHPVDNDKKVKELGDILYYVARSASVLGYSLEEVCLMNQAKLYKRYPNGFEAEKSVNREE
jgi:NTP pyrophosphatase (non-canonical NTP hydrolase)